VSDASSKCKAATDTLTRAAVQIRLWEGNVEHGFGPKAYRKWNDASNEWREAMKRRAAESDRLLRLAVEEPGRFGWP
jgi:hypothetical protein